MESPRSDVGLIQGDQGLSDMETAFDEIEKGQLQLSLAVTIPRTRTRISVFVVVQTTDTKNTLSSAFMSEVSILNLQMLVRETFGESNAGREGRNLMN